MQIPFATTHSQIVNAICWDNGRNFTVWQISTKKANPNLYPSTVRRERGRIEVDFIIFFVFKVVYPRLFELKLDITITAIHVDSIFECGTSLFSLSSAVLVRIAFTTSMVEEIQKSRHFCCIGPSMAELMCKLSSKCGTSLVSIQVHTNTENCIRPWIITLEVKTRYSILDSSYLQRIWQSTSCCRSHRKAQNDWQVRVRAPSTVMWIHSGLQRQQRERKMAFWIRVSSSQGHLDPTSVAVITNVSRLITNVSGLGWKIIFFSRGVLLGQLSETNDDSSFIRTRNADHGGCQRCTDNWEIRGSIQPTARHSGIIQN